MRSLGCSIKSYQQLSGYMASMFMLLVLAGCQLTPLEVHSVANDEVDFSQYQTVSVKSIDEKNAFTSMMIKGIEKDLVGKGYIISDQPDLVFVYQVDVKEGEQLNQKLQTGGRHVFNVTSLEAVYEAKVLINAIDAKSGNVVWKASTSKDIRSVNKKAIDQERIDQRMAELCASFPER